jgi:hypothetical protein
MFMDPMDFFLNLSYYDKASGTVPLYTDKHNSADLLIDVTALLFPTPKKVLVTAMSAKGTYLDVGGQISVLHNPIEETMNTMFEFRLASDGHTVEVLQPQLGLRTSDAQSVEAYIESDPLLWLGSLTKIDTTNFSAVVVDGVELIRKGFYVAQQQLHWMVRYHVREVRSRERNFDVVLEYVDDMQVSQTVCFSIAILPDTPMTPRANDARLSYFTMDYEDVGVHSPQLQQVRENPSRSSMDTPKKSENPSRKSMDTPKKHVDTPVSVIWRYNLDALPGNQIRICIDPTVPERWRESFRKGIEGWNAAFSLAGYPNAVRGVTPSDKDWPSDYDAGDVRFNTISWSLSDEVVSMGIAKVDPRSGEIIKSDIIMSDGWVRSWLDDLTRMAPQLVKHHGRGYRREEGTIVDVLTNINAVLRPLHEQPPGLFASHLSKTAWEDVVAAGLQSIVMHETGHILGLRHNFKGSLGVSYECTQDISCTAIHGLSASVMDYIPMNVPSSGSDKVHFFTPVVGAYDKAAIQYGYTKLDEALGTNPPTPPHQLDSLLQAAEGFQLCLDEEYHAALDPLCEAYDLSASPLRYYTDQLDRVVGLQKQLLNNSVAPGGPYWNYGSAARSLWTMVDRIGYKLSFWIGGANTSYLHRGTDGNNDRSAMRSIPVAQQRHALRLILRILKPHRSKLLPPKETLSFMVTQDLKGVSGLDLARLVRQTQRFLVQALFRKQTLLRLEMMSGLDGLGVAEFLRQVSKSVFDPDTLATDEWDLQQLVAEELDALQDDKKLPEPVASHVAMSIDEVRDRIAASLHGLRKPKLPDEKQLLAVHLRRLHSLLAVEDDVKSSASATTLDWQSIAVSILPTIGLGLLSCL